MFARMSSLPIIEGRSCGECTECCTHLTIPDPPEIAHERGTPCARLGPGGCTAYDERPRVCRVFECAWLEGAGNDDARPDRSGVIIHFFRAKGVPIISATETRAGACAPDGWAWPFLRDCGHPVIITRIDGEQIAMIPMGKGETAAVTEAELKAALGEPHGRA
jgi:hypothetical protein